MGIELPAELADVAERTGLRWPEADEDALLAQAAAWREAERELGALAADADAAAGGALGAMSGPAAEAAGRMWSGFVDPDTGHLTGTARGAGQAAERLEHAAEQVGATKAELVRQLVEAAKNRDAAVSAADAGHPTALLGLDTALRGTAANLGAATEGLVDAVGPGERPAAVEPLNVNPGAHGADGQSGLLSATTGLPATVVEAGLSTVDPAVVSAEPAADGLTGGEHARSPVLPEPVPAEPFPPEPAPPAADEGTGPIALAVAPTPPRGNYGGFLSPAGFDDVPTPPAGVPLAQGVPTPPAQTTLSGFTGGAAAPGVPAAPPPVTAQPGAQFPGQQLGPAPAPPYGAAGGAPMPGGAAPPVAGFAGQQHQYQQHARHPGPAAGAHWAPRNEPADTRGQPRPYAPQGRPPEPVRPQPPAAPVPVGSPRQERQSVIALFLVHMFPIGHLPVASDRPARQLPVPDGDTDYAAGLRFPPHDHPRSAVIDPGHALAWLRNGWRQPAPPPRAVLPCPPEALTAEYDPLGGMHEREWDRRYLVSAGEPPEYAWPPGERYPEGGSAEGEPVLLAEGTLLDRFGTALGRVFAADATPFAARSLPPSSLEAGYRRYRVRREVPMWRAVSAGWFGQPGGGERLRAVYSAAELVTLGYLADMTFEEVGQR
ncbi:TNT domain-containing protein [Qaidamihabitans albus]|uniref:TNT domain-containing protein n=1 Tax=Qaidamihabitans albus TaxID=2795733 RepID=UPI0018F13D1F|nr:TNT domain-containing protein [Qaidamihabitans albus]